MRVASLESKRPEEPEQELGKLKEGPIGVAMTATIEREPEAPRNEHPSDNPVRCIHFDFKSNRLLM